MFYLRNHCDSRFGKVTSHRIRRDSQNSLLDIQLDIRHEDRDHLFKFTKEKKRFTGGLGLHKDTVFAQRLGLLFQAMGLLFSRKKDMFTYTQSSFETLFDHKKNEFGLANVFENRKKLMKIL